MSASLWAPLSVLLVAAGGWFVARRKTKADTADMITKAAGNLVEQITGQMDRTEARAKSAEEQAAAAQARATVAEQRAEAAEQRAEQAEHRASAAERRADEAAAAVNQRDQVIARQTDEIAALRARVDELEQHDRNRTGETPVVPSPGSPT